MRRVIWLLLLGAVVVGCADQQKQLIRGLSGLIGLNIHRAVDILGSPDGQQRDVMGDTVYTWSTHQEVVLFDTGPERSTVGGNPVYGSTSSTGTHSNGTTRPDSMDARSNGETSPTTLAPTAFQCTIEITTDKNGTITRYQFEGNEGGCQRYASRMR